MTGVMVFLALMYSLTASRNRMPGPSLRSIGELGIVIASGLHEVVYRDSIYCAIENRRTVIQITETSCSPFDLRRSK